MNVRLTKPSWSSTDSKDNAAAVATRAAPTGGLRHQITSVSASFSAAPGAPKLLQLKSGTDVVMEWFVSAPVSIVFSSPVEITPALDVNLVLASSGAGGTVGKVNLTGYTA